MKAIQGDITTLPVDAIVNAAHLAVTTVKEFLDTHDVDMRVTFCCFSPRDLHVYQDQLNAL